MLHQLPSVSPGFHLMVSCLLFLLALCTPAAVILYRPRYTLQNSWVDSSGRFVLADFQHRDVIFCVACIYTPNQNPDRDTFFSFVSSKIDPSVPTVVCGNFNAVFDRTIDRRGSNVLDPSRESSASLLSL